MQRLPIVVTVHIREFCKSSLSCPIIDPINLGARRRSHSHRSASEACQMKLEILYGEQGLKAASAVALTMLPWVSCEPFISYVIECTAL